MGYTALPVTITSTPADTDHPTTEDTNHPTSAATNHPDSSSLPSDGLGFFIGTTTADDFLLLGDTGFFLVS